MPVPEDKLRLGGMALRNGLLVHGPTHWSAAVRAKDGSVKVASGSKPRLYAFDDVPGVRGLVRLGEAFAVIPLVKKGLPEAKLAFENPSVLGVAAATTVVASLIKRRAPGTAGEFASALIGLAPAVFALRGGELAAYHGVEHKAIAAYEADDEDAARRAEGARALRLAPDGADAGRQPRGHAAAQAHDRAAHAAGRRRGRPGEHGRRRRDLRLERAPHRLARSRRRSSGPATSCRRPSAPASPTSASSRSAARRSTEILRVEDSN